MGDDKPDLGVEVPVPRSQEQAKRLFSNDKIKTLVKLKLQEYLESFFRESGINRDLLKIASPRFINYNVEKSFDQATDPTQRKMQIARFFADLKAIIPAILVVDGGIIPVPQSIGLIDHATVVGNTWRGYYPISRTIPISIVAAARDVESADEMSGIISLIFNEMRNLAGGQYITGKKSEAETWVIQLPNGPVSVSALSEVSVGADPLEKIWYSEAVLEVYFEDVLAVKREIPEIVGTRSYVGDPDLKVSIKPVIMMPDQLSINSQTTVRIDNIADNYQVLLSDSKIATLAYNMTLTPRRLGKVSVQVFDPVSKTVLAEKEIEITM